jgi:glutaminyl-peptide cyclotransferase
VRIPFATSNGTQALAQVTVLCDLGPRDAGTPGGERAARWIANELRQAGLPARLDSFTNQTPSGPLICHNVLAEIPAATPEPSLAGRRRPALPVIVLLSHFDTKSGIAPDFIGANDGGSSTGLLLELARLLQRTPLRHCRVLCGFVDGEECRIQFGPHDGLHGSRRLASQLADSRQAVRAVILLDMIGDRDLTVTLPANGTPQLTLLALEAAKQVGARDQFRLADTNILDDHQPFLDAGFPAVDLIDFVYGSAPGLHDYWHTAQDTVDKLSATSLTTMGQVVAEMLGRLDTP